jgi:hypothetical protein
MGRFFLASPDEFSFVKGAGEIIAHFVAPRNLSGLPGNLPFFQRFLVRRVTSCTIFDLPESFLGCFRQL